jgi:hypothetical protein
MKTKGAIEIILAAASASTLLETNSPPINNIKTSMVISSL